MSQPSLHQLYSEHLGKVSDKWSLYLSEYHRLLADFRRKPVRLLEIGVQNGGSLEIWAKYFNNAERLVGCDINPMCEKLKYDDRRIVVIVGDANADQTEAKIIEAADGKFDLIIDDGSHRSSDIVNSFARYFPHLGDSGLYIVEDLHCSYWQTYEGGLAAPFSSVAFFKRLADITNHEHWGVDKTRVDLLSVFFAKYGYSVSEELLAHVHSVEFINSMCVVRKRMADHNRLGVRCLAGKAETVVTGLVDQRSSNSVAPDQRNNIWATGAPVEEELLRRLDEIQALALRMNECDERVKSLTSLIAERDEQLVRQTECIARKDTQAEEFASTIAELKEKMTRLDEVLAERNAQVTQLWESTVERDKQAARLRHILANRDRQLLALRSSLSWKVTLPLRFISHEFIRTFDQIRLRKRNRCVPLRALRLIEEGRWFATDEDPQFELLLGRFELDRGWHRLTVEGNGLQSPELFLDYGDGFRPEYCYPLIPRNNRFEVTLQLDKQAVRARLDPTKAEGEFDLGPIEISRIRTIRIFAEKALVIYRRDRLLGMSPMEIVAQKWEILKRIGPRQLATKLGRFAVESNSALRPDEELSYEQWISQVEKVYVEDLSQLALNSTRHGHVFYVFVNETFLPQLTTVLKSLLAQKGISWRSVVFCENQVVDTIDKLDIVDDRIRFTNYDSVHFERELAQLSDEVVTLVSPGITLSPNYLLALEYELRTRNNKDFILYTDSDIADGGEKRSNPSFKPDWSPDYFLEYDYIGGVISVSGSIFTNTKVSIWPRVENVVWWLLARLAIGEFSVDVLHIPFVLFHADRYAAKSLNMESRQELLNLQLRSRGASAIAGNVPETLRIRYRLPTEVPRVTIIIPTRDRIDLLERCISTLLEKTLYSNYEVLVVDNQSKEVRTQKYFEKIAAQNNIRVIPYDRPFNFSAINNFAVEGSNSELLCFLNNDIEIIDADWLSELVALLKRPNIGCVGACLLYPSGSVQHAGVLIGKGGVAGHIFRGSEPTEPGYQNRLQVVQNYSAVTGACLLTSRDLFERLGGFNEQYLAVAFNDVDYCLRVREAGQLICWTPHVRLVHHESASRGDDAARMEAFAQEIRFMKVRWTAWLSADPAYNSHLSLAEAEFKPSTRWLRSEKQARMFEGLENPVHRLYAYESNIERVRRVLAGGRKFDESETDVTGLSVVILTLEKPELIGPLLDVLVDAREHLMREFGFPLEIIVGDTGSRSAEVEMIYARHAKHIRLQRGLKYQFSKCNNDLFQSFVRHERVLFLNNDIVFTNATEQLLALCNALDRNPSVGIIGSQLLYPDGRLQHGGIDIFRSGEMKGLCYHPRHGEDVRVVPPIGEVKEYPAVTGACLLIRSSLFRRCGGFDERYLAEAQDVDLCLKARRLGWSTQLAHVGTVVHIENATRAKGEENYQDRARFIRKWGGYCETEL